MSHPFIDCLPPPRLRLAPYSPFVSPAPASPRHHPSHGRLLVPRFHPAYPTETAALRSDSSPSKVPSLVGGLFPGKNVSLVLHGLRASTVPQTMRALSLRGKIAPDASAERRCRRFACRGFQWQSPTGAQSRVFTR
ncbi:hypothetical protein MPNT_30128 [Candidatus Methylacidithermus pantelleriae]|uniref:Uncharacterized protein n=1 Tax=Candidatus Methylacidithermus pantelleriae TaxID=2744239 RepID=A0A8J2BJ60_9BACT|nr:hypothetical protein MPNT_30128 [Candidatus Methylacidithermus pantelleriae]